MTRDNGRTIACAWAAGLFEGEGCTAINRRRTRSGAWQYMLVCAVHMGDREPLERLEAEWGGRIYSAPVRGNRRPMWRWVASTREAPAFLNGILPYVAAERVACKIRLAREFQGQKRNTGCKPPPEYLLAQTVFYERMRFLNRRGSKAAA